MTRLALLAAATLLGAVASALAATGGESGAAIVRHGTRSGVIPCMACHGAHLEGNGSIGAPPLAGLSSRRIVAALDAIAAGKAGDNFVMQREARLLAPGQRQAVAAYLAHLAKKKQPQP